MVQKPNYNNTNYDIPDSFSNINTKTRLNSDQLNDGYDINNQGSLGRFLRGFHLNWLFDWLFRWVKYLTDKSDQNPTPIKIDIGTNASYLANTVIPNNAVVEKLVLVKDVVYPIGTTIQVTLPGPLVLMSTTESNPTIVDVDVTHKYISVGLANTDKPTVTIGGLPVSGSGRVLIYYRSGFES